MGNAKNDFIIPIVVLTLICIVTSTALAATQQVTAPIIAAAEKAAAEAARLEVLPGSASFEVVTLSPMPEGIEEVFKSEKGLVIQATVKGYGGPMKIMVGLDNDGNIVKTKILLHTETAGLGSKTAEEPFQSQFVGKDATLEGITTIGGATISSNAFITGVKKAFDAATMAAGGTSASPAGATEEKLKGAQ